MSQHQLDILITVGTTVMSLIAGYFLATINEYIANNRLRLVLIRSVWKDLMIHEPEAPPDHPFLIMPCPVSVIETIINRGLLESSKYQELLIEMLELRGLLYHLNTMSQLTNTLFIMQGHNGDFESKALWAVHKKAREQAQIVRSLIIKLYPKETWN